MKLCRCPICHSDIHLDALIEDDAARDVLSLLLKFTHNCARPVVAYVALFRPAKSNLSNSRTAKLMEEVLEQFKPSRHLAYALNETVKQIHKNRASSNEIKPLANHNYLKTVYDSTARLFLYTETKVNEQIKESNEVYFEQMYRAKADFSKINVTGAMEWYKKRRERDERG
jgi:hypothetical protein